jgi:hypothetical protein
VTIHAGSDRAELSTALAAAGVQPELLNAPGASYARSRDGQVDGFLIVPNYGTEPLELSDVVVRIDARRRIEIPHLRVPPRDALVSPINLRVRSGLRLAYTDCPLEAFTSWRGATAQTPVLQDDTCRLHFNAEPDQRLGSRPAQTRTAALDTSPGDAAARLPVRRDALLPGGPSPEPVEPASAVVRRRDVYREGNAAVVLENALVRVVIAPEAGARAFVFEDNVSHHSIFTSVGAMRDDVTPEPPLSSTDRIAKYTHQFSAGTFNRPYSVTLPAATGGSAVAEFAYTAPDITLPGGPADALQSATFQRHVSLAPNVRTFSVDERVAFGASSAAPTSLRAVSVSSLAVGAAQDMRTAFLLLPESEPFAAQATRRVAGNAFGFYDAASGELATIAWHDADVERADILEEDYSVVVRLTLAPNRLAHVEYGYFKALTPAAARTQLDAAARAAQGRTTAFANSAR